MSWLPLLLAGSLAVTLVMVALWLAGIARRNFSYVDIGWSVNFAVLAAIYGLCGGGDPFRRGVIAAMFAFWGLRLGLHLARRIAGRPEEGRYVALRAAWGASGNLNLKFLAFFLFQAALNVVLGLPLLIACLDPSPRFGALELAGVAVWCIGLCGESIADSQLRAFKREARNAGAVCTRGLWGWSRHPNYFFEWLIWIGYALFALASPFGSIALAMPVLMLHFLINVTGIRATEEQALRSKGEAYRRYQQTTSAFVPWPPRRRV